MRIKINGYISCAIAWVTLLVLSSHTESRHYELAVAAKGFSPVVSKDVSKIWFSKEV